MPLAAMEQRLPLLREQRCVSEAAEKTRRSKDRSAAADCGSGELSTFLAQPSVDEGRRGGVELDLFRPTPHSGGKGTARGQLPPTPAEG